MRSIIPLGEPVLRAICTPVTEPATAAALVADLQDTLAHSRATTGYGRGIAAPQLGVTQRVVFLNVIAPWPLLNPEIIDRSPETFVVWDACLSFLSIFMPVRRHVWIRVRYQDLAGQTHEVVAGPEHDYSELLQHEIDHLDGILCLDRVEDVKTIISKEVFEARYRANSPYA